MFLPWRVEKGKALDHDSGIKLRMVTSFGPSGARGHLTVVSQLGHWWALISPIAATIGCKRSIASQSTGTGMGKHLQYRTDPIQLGEELVDTSPASFAGLTGFQQEIPRAGPLGGTGAWAGTIEVRRSIGQHDSLSFLSPESPKPTIPSDSKRLAA